MRPEQRSGAVERREEGEITRDGARAGEDGPRELEEGEIDPASAAAAAADERRSGPSTATFTAPAVPAAPAAPVVPVAHAAHAAHATSTAPSRLHSYLLRELGDLAGAARLGASGRERVARAAAAKLLEHYGDERRFFGTANAGGASRGGGGGRRRPRDDAGDVDEGADGAAPSASRRQRVLNLLGKYVERHQHH